MTTNSLQKALVEALSFGYQISPKALTVLKDFGKGRSEISVEEIVRKVIEEKARGKSSKSIEIDDLVSVFPDIFEGVAFRLSRSASMASGVKEGGKDLESEVEIVSDSGSLLSPGVETFSFLFKSRYEKLVKILMERPEGRQLIKISKMGKEKGNARIAGLVSVKRPTKSGGVEFTLDDDTGNVSVLVSSSEVKKALSEITLDQCIMVDVDASQGRLLAKNIFQPDTPSRVASTSKKTVYAVFLSDLHVGSDKFMESAFNRFLEWLNGVTGRSEEDEEIIGRLKYLVIGGDIVDGVGVFPNQEYELAEQDVYKQYEMVAKKLKLVPRHLQMFVIPGNHDATRQALPQPMIPRKYAEGLYSLLNVRMLGDPCLFKLNGVSVLTYHGRSLDDVLATTPGLSYQRPEEAMKVLLRARHLAPIFGHRTPIAPEREDSLVIEQVPDIFHCGHVHAVGEDNYKSTLILNSGCWQAQTGYQANLGISPRPGIVPVVNLATIEVVWKEFLTSFSLGSK